MMFSYSDSKNVEITKIEPINFVIGISVPSIWGSEYYKYYDIFTSKLILVAYLDGNGNKC